MKKAFAAVLAVWAAVCVFGCAAQEHPDREEAGEAVFSFQGTPVPIGESAEPVLEALGEPLSYTEEPSCAYTGLDRTYYYGGFYVSTCPSVEGEIISGVWFADDSVTTAAGICIGAGQEAVEAAYGAECFNGTNAYTVTAAASRLTVIVSDGTVTGIHYDARPE